MAGGVGGVAGIVVVAVVGGTVGDIWDSDIRTPPCFAQLTPALKHTQCAGSLSHRSPFSSSLPPPAASPNPLRTSQSRHSNMQTCSGSKARDSAPCPCTSFAAKPPPKDSRCNSCGHRRSAHQDAPSSDNKYVQRLLNGLAATAIHKEAQKETLEGFCHDLVSFSL